MHSLSIGDRFKIFLLNPSSPRSNPNPTHDLIHSYSHLINPGLAAVAFDWLESTEGHCIYYIYYVKKLAFAKTRLVVLEFGYHRSPPELA